MSEEHIQNTNKRRPWIAVTLSLILPGLGHIYSGKLVKGLFILFICGLPIVTLEAVIIFKTSALTIPLVVLVIIITYMLYIIVIVDSHYLAKNTRADYSLKEYNRWYVYILLVLIYMGSSVAWASNIRACYFEAFYVPASSMFPTIHNGDRFIANKIAYKNANPQRGDIIVFINPEDRHMNYIKRIVAIEGDTIEIQEGQLLINGLKLNRTHTGPAELKGTNQTVRGQIFTEQNGAAEYQIFLADNPETNNDTLTDFGPIKIPQNHCFVLGDNRHGSKDSRHFGPIPLATIKGRAGMLYFSSDSWSRLGKLN